MAARKPIRIYFGMFHPLDWTHGAVIDDQTDDRAFANFLTGKMISASRAMHTRRPSGSEGFIPWYDEYLDLKQAAIEPTDANDLLLFKNIAGVESLLIWADQASYSNIPTNMYTIGTVANEFFYPTRRITKPYPTTDPVPPRVEWRFFENDIPSSPTGYVRLYVVLHDTGVTKTSSPCYGIDVPIDSGSPATYELRIHNDNTYTCKYSIFRAPIDSSILDRSKQLTDFAKGVTGFYQTGSIASGSYADVSGLLGTVALNSEYMEEPALNDAVARIAFCYKRRSNLTSVGQLKNEILVLNSSTHMYYKGLIGACSPMFTEGVAARTEDTAQLIIQVTEQGSWSDEAWDEPNGTLTLLVSGTTSHNGGWTHCIDSTKNFVTLGVNIGDVVINKTGGWSANVLAIQSLYGTNDALYVTGKAGAIWTPGDEYEVWSTGNEYLHMHSRSVVNL